MVNDSINFDVDKLSSLSENLPSSLWVELLVTFRYVLKNNWFNDDESKADELLEAMKNGDKERAVEIIDNEEESEQIRDTIHSVCTELECEETVDHETIESLDRWVE